MDLTQEQIGAHLGLSQQQVSAWLAKLGLTVEAGLDTIRLAYIEALRAAAAERAPNEDRQGLVRARRQLAELQLAREAGAMVDAVAVRKAAFGAAREMRNAILQIPDRIDPLLLARADPVERARIWNQELRTLCEAMSRRLRDMGAATEGEHL